MLVQNPNLAGKELLLRYSGKLVKGDADGVFDVPEKDGRFLLDNGDTWRQPKKAKPVAAPKTAAEAPKPPKAPEPKAAPEPAPEAKPEPAAAADDAESADDAEEGPDLDSMTKGQLLKTAEEYGIDSVTRHMSKNDIKAVLDREIYGEEG